MIFSYADKDPSEYQALHTVNGKTPTAGYADVFQQVTEHPDAKFD